MKFTVFQARRYAGLTQKEMAKMLDIDRGTYIKIEKDAGKATVKQIGDISRVTGIPIKDFILPFESTKVDSSVESA